jgi:DNA-binding NarL/FixJ family response regulator
MTAVWIVEDNDFYRHSIVEMLQRSDRYCDLQSFRSCEEMLEMLERDVPPDVILLDIELPGMSGIEGIGRIKSISPSTHIIILTIHDDDNNVFNALAAGASGYLLKSLPREKIDASIEEVLNGGAPMNAQIARKVLNLFASFAASPQNYRLTMREKEILGFMIEGKPTKAIAHDLNLSYHTIDNHIRNIYSKLQVNTRTAAVAKALKERLL